MIKLKTGQYEKDPATDLFTLPYVGQPENGKAMGQRHNVSDKDDITVTSLASSLLQGQVAAKAAKGVPEESSPRSQTVTEKTRLPDLKNREGRKAACEEKHNSDVPVAAELLKHEAAIPDNVSKSKNAHSDSLKRSDIHEIPKKIALKKTATNDVVKHPNTPEDAMATEKDINHQIQGIPMSSILPDDAKDSEREPRKSDPTKGQPKARENNIVEEDENDSHTSCAKEAIHMIRFEVQFAGLASTTLLCYCLAHMTVYEIIYGILLELTDDHIQNFYALYAFLMMTGLLIMRSTGVLWIFLVKRRFRESQGEMKRRLERGSWDALFEQWIENKPNFKAALDVIGFYLCYISMNFFWNEFLSCVVDQRHELFQLLPSRLHYRELLSNSSSSCMMLPDFDFHLDSISDYCQQEYLDADDDEIDWQEEDLEFLYDNLAKSSYYQYKGSTEVPLFSAMTGMIVYLSAATMSIYCLSKIGLAFSKNW